MSDPFTDGVVEFEFIEGAIEPVGVAEVQCVGMVQSYSKAGNPMIEWSFRLLRYIDGDKGDEFIGKEWTVYTALTEKAQWKVHETLVALGLRSDDDKNTKVKFKRDDALGVVCLAEITHDTFRGQQQSGINALAPHNTKPGEKQPIEEQEVSDPFTPDPISADAPDFPATDTDNIAIEDEAEPATATTRKKAKGRRGKLPF